MLMQFLTEMRKYQVEVIVRALTLRHEAHIAWKTQLYTVGPVGNAGGLFEDYGVDIDTTSVRRAS